MEEGFCGSEERYALVKLLRIDSQKICQCTFCVSGGSTLFLMVESFLWNKLWHKIQTIIYGTSGAFVVCNIVVIVDLNGY